MPAVAGQRRDGMVVPAHVQRRGMTGVGKTNPAAVNIRDEIKGRGKNGVTSLTEDTGQPAIELREQLPGVGVLAGAFFQQRTHHRGHQRRAHAVAHHIADEHADAVV